MIGIRFKQIRSLFAVFLLPLCLSACSMAPGGSGLSMEDESEGKSPDTRRFLKFVDEEPDTVDPQCTSKYYTIGLNIFDRLVEVEVQADGTSDIVPSLADSWEISEDGLVYTFHLHEGVTFSNGSPLTSSDVGYTLTRLLTHPDSCNQDIAEDILGARELAEGKAQRLEGFEIIDDLDFSITLSAPYSAFLACLSTPGASILDEATTKEAGERFGKDPLATIGTGPFIFQEWEEESGLLLAANENCWSGAPLCEGLDIQFVLDSEAQRLMFEKGELDILDLENLGNEAEYFIRGDIYQDLLYQGPRVGISYLALNESAKPLNDVRVRRALQLALDRQLLLNAVYSGRGTLENGIFPQGLIGFNPDLPEIPYDPEQAKTLLEKAGYPDGFDLEISMESNSADNIKDLLTLTASMWKKIGINASIRVMDEEEFMGLRKQGKLSCYTGKWSADFNDPDNFIHTFFGSEENTLSRSLCYPKKDILKRVHDARAILDKEERIGEYQKLEQKIIQEDAAWVPLFSNQHYFVVSDRVEGFAVSWNGWSSNQYRDIVIKE